MSTGPGRMVLIGSVFAIVAVLGVVDWLSGHELNFFVFYFLPVSFAAWYLDRYGALVAAVLSALTWYLANDLGRQLSTLHAYAAWNTLIRLCAFLCIGLAMAQMRRLLFREQEATAALRQALSEIRTLHGILPICAQCKKIRNEAGAWEQMEAYISEHTESRFSHGYCPECASKAMEEAGLSDRERDTPSKGKIG